MFILSLTILPVQARVFRRWGGRAEAGRALEALGAKQAYAAPVILNGGRGSLSVYGLDLPLGTALRRVGKALNVAFDASGDASMFVESMNIPSGKLRLIAIAPPDITRTLFFLIEQSRSEADRSASPPATADLPDVPAFPGSAPLFVAADEKAKASLAVSTTTAHGEAVMNFYSQHLARSGWTPALPGGLQGIYLKGQTICCVQTSERERQTHITVFHKELSNKPNP